jgi:cell division septal protein FtsQ
MVETEGQRRLRIARILGIVLATAIACVVIIYFSIPMSDTQQSQFDVILVLGNPAIPSDRSPDRAYWKRSGSTTPELHRVC